MLILITILFQSPSRQLIMTPSSILRDISPRYLEFSSFFFFSSRKNGSTLHTNTHSFDCQNQICCKCVFGEVKGKKEVEDSKHHSLETNWDIPLPFCHIKWFGVHSNQTHSRTVTKTRVRFVNDLMIKEFHRTIKIDPVYIIYGRLIRIYQKDVLVGALCFISEPYLIIFTL